MADNPTNYEVTSNGVHTSNTVAANKVETSVDVHIDMSDTPKSITSKIILAINNTYMYVYCYQIY